MGGSDGGRARAPRSLRRREAEAEARESRQAVQRMLGHAKASVTLDVYADLFDTDLDAVAVELDAAIKPAAAQSHEEKQTFVPVQH